MLRRNIFPTRDAEFHIYFLQVVTYLIGTIVPDPTFPAILPDRIFRLGMTYDGLHPLWALYNQWAAIFPKSQNPDLRTTAITNQKNTIRENIETELRKLYSDIPETKIIEDDRETLNLHRRDATPSARPAITTAPEITIQALSGGQVRIVCRVDSDSTRPSMHPDANDVEIRYQVGGTAPVSPTGLPNALVSSKSKFMLHLNVADAGKRVYMYLRWINSSDDSKSGPCTRLLSAIISD